MVIADQSFDRKRGEVHGAGERGCVVRGGGEEGEALARPPLEKSVKRGNHKPLGQTPSGEFTMGISPTGLLTCNHFIKFAKFAPGKFPIQV